MMYQFLIGNVRLVFTDHDEAERVYQFLIGNVRHNIYDFAGNVDEWTRINSS